jgi:hypothetical protein
MTTRIWFGMLTGLTLLPVAACAQDMPPRKAGLWVTTMDMGRPNQPPIETKMCIDATTDAAMLKSGMAVAAGHCSRRDITRDGNKITIDTECAFGDRKLTSHGVMTFIDDTATHAEFTSHSVPPSRAGGDHTMVQDAKWIGPCPSDMVPGDMIGPNGMKMNVKTIMEQGK